MPIDIIVALLLLWAVIKGWQKGLVMGVFLVLAFAIGLTAAVKCSAMAANYLSEHTSVNARWLPFLSFALVFIGVILLVNLMGKAVEKTLELGMMGWANRLGGVLMYLFIHLFVFSVILFYANQLHLISESAKSQSHSYSLLQPLAPRIIEGIGQIIPFIKDVFKDLEHFFNQLAATPATAS